MAGLKETEAVPFQKRADAAITSLHTRVFFYFQRCFAQAAVRLLAEQAGDRISERLQMALSFVVVELG